MANDVMAFAIALKDSIGTPEFYARVHPPLRVSPLGSPILSVSVADTRLSEKLIARHIESSQVSKTDFSRIFGKRPCPTPIFTTNGISLLRYLFRLNSKRSETFLISLFLESKFIDYLNVFFSPNRMLKDI